MPFVRDSFPNLCARTKSRVHPPLASNIVMYQYDMAKHHAYLSTYRSQNLQGHICVPIQYRYVLIKLVYFGKQWYSFDSLSLFRLTERFFHNKAAVFSLPTCFVCRRVWRHLENQPFGGETPNHTTLGCKVQTPERASLKGRGALSLPKLQILSLQKTLNASKFLEIH